MRDLIDLLPHSKKDVKIDSKSNATLINEIIELNNCTSCIYFESRKHSDLYMWCTRLNGPSCKFLVQNIHTMSELKLTGNSIKGSRPLILFDGTFDTQPYYRVIKQLLHSIYNTPYMHPRSKPFIDRIQCFYICDHKIYVRNYQIQYNILLDSKIQHTTVHDNIAQNILNNTTVQHSITEQNTTKPILVEIGPRYILTPIRIFSNSLFGQTLWSNALYESPNTIRSRIKRQYAERYNEKINEKINGIQHKHENIIHATEVDNVFVTGEDAYHHINKPIHEQADNNSDDDDISHGSSSASE